MSGAICAIFIFSSPQDPFRPQRTLLPKVPHLTPAAKRKIGGETHPVRKFIILYGNSSFRVGDRRQKRDFRASRIESRVLNDDWHVRLEYRGIVGIARLEYRGIVGIARNRLRVVEIIKA